MVSGERDCGRDALVAADLVVCAASEKYLHGGACPPGAVARLANRDGDIAIHRYEKSRTSFEACCYPTPLCWQTVWLRQEPRTDRCNSCHPWLKPLFSLRFSAVPGGAAQRWTLFSASCARGFPWPRRREVRRVPCAGRQRGRVRLDGRGFPRGGWRT